MLLWNIRLFVITRRDLSRTPIRELSTNFRLRYLENFRSLFKWRLFHRPLVGSRWAIRFFVRTRRDLPRRPIRNFFRTVNKFSVLRKFSITLQISVISQTIESRKNRNKKFVESSEEFWLAFWVNLDELLQKVLWFKAIGLLRKELRGFILPV